MCLNVRQLITIFENSINEILEISSGILIFFYFFIFILFYFLMIIYICCSACKKLIISSNCNTPVIPNWIDKIGISIQQLCINRLHFLSKLYFYFIFFYFLNQGILCIWKNKPQFMQTFKTIQHFFSYFDLLSHF